MGQFFHKNYLLKHLIEERDRSDGEMRKSRYAAGSRS